MSYADGLEAAIEAAQEREALLVATDFDGVLAPLVEDPTQSAALPGSVEALRTLAAQPGVHVAVVSGRALATLSSVTGLPLDGPIRLVGSHGAETELVTSARELSPSEEAVLSRLTRQVRGLRERVPGVRLEYKPTAVVVHSRGLSGMDAMRAVRQARALGVQPGVNVKVGKDVVELTVVRADKGSAVLDLAAECHADAVVYFGDDVTDEDVFKRLGPSDVGIKIGQGETAATWRVDAPADVVALLTAMAGRARRSRHP